MNGKVKSLLNRLCGVRNETVFHIFCEDKKLQQREYKRSCNNFSKIKHWKLYKKHLMNKKEKWFEY